MRPAFAPIGTGLLVLAMLGGCAQSGLTAPPAASPPRTKAAATTGVPSPEPALIATASPGAAPGTIVYEGTIPDGVGVRVVGTDGTGDRWLFPEVKIPKDGWQRHPDWDRAGARVAFAADDSEDPAGTETTRDLWVGDADGSNAARVFDCEAPCILADDASWSPDGRTLAFVTWGPQPASLALLDIATGSVTVILTVANEPDGFRRPRWSPDGRRIVLEHQTWTGGPDDQIVDTAIGIVELDAPTPAFAPITKLDMWATSPDWHPTEDRILFSTRPWTVLPDGPSRLYTIRPDGTELIALTPANETARAVQPSWTPDGTAVLFTRVIGTGFGDPSMATIRADGTGLGPATADGWQFGTFARLRPTSP